MTEYLHKVVKIPKIKVSPETENVLLKLSALVAELWNIFLALQMTEYENDRKIQSSFDLNMVLPNQNKRLKGEYGSLSNVPEDSPMYQWIRLGKMGTPLYQGTGVILCGMWKSFFGNKKRRDKTIKPPGPRSQQEFATLFWNNVADSGLKIDTENKTISLSHQLERRGRIHIHIPEDAFWDPNGSYAFAGKEVMSVTLWREPRDFSKPGHFGISLAYRYPAPDVTSVENVVAISRGSYKMGIVTSKGKAWVHKVDRKDLWVREEMVSKPHESNGENYPPLAQRIFEGEGPQRKLRLPKHHTEMRKLLKARRRFFKYQTDYQVDQQRKLVQTLLALGDVFIIGDSDVRVGMAQSDASKKTHWGVQNTGYMDRLLELLKAKAAELGKIVIVVDDKNAARFCCKCGMEHRELTFDAPNSKDELNCSCGMKVPKKINTALELLKRGMATLTKQHPTHWPQERIDKTLRFLHGHAEKIRKPNRLKPD